MKSVLFALAAVAITVAGCAPIANTSNTTLVRKTFNARAISGAQFPVIVSGAESVGVAPAVLAQSLRFPAGLVRNSSFRAVETNERLTNHARLDIAPQGDLATATLTFLAGERRIGAGRFTLERSAFSNPAAVGRISAVMIHTMLLEAKSETIQSRRPDR